MEVADHRVRTLEITYEPPISDSQYKFSEGRIVYLTIESDTGISGVGFGGVSQDTPEELVREEFASRMEALLGESPFHLLARMNRPRGGHYHESRFGGPTSAIDIALWDLCAKHLELPLYALLGGTDPAVPAYASGLHYSLDDVSTRRWYRDYAEQGFDAAKVKVGYPTVEEDIQRLRLVKEAMGGCPTLLVDANEAWSPKEAIRRLYAYRDAGLDIHWVEDPILRDDLEGHRRIAEQVPFTHLNVGEYVNFEAKRELLEHRAADILHLSRGYLTTALREVTLASAYGVPVAFHDTIGHVCIHLAAAVPELAYFEYWPRPWDDLMSDPLTIEDGQAFAPGGPGHGVTIPESAF